MGLSVPPDSIEPAVSSCGARAEFLALQHETHRDISWTRSMASFTRASGKTSTTAAMPWFDENPSICVPM